MRGTKNNALILKIWGVFILVLSMFPCLQSFPASGSFPMSQFFTSGGQSIGVSASASVFPMNIQGCFPLGLLVWSPCCPKVKVKSLSCARLFATPWTVAYQVPLSMGFSRQEYWSGLPFPSLGDPPNPGIEPRSPALEADALLSEPPGKSYAVQGTLKSFLQHQSL